MLELYEATEGKELQSWLDHESCEMLSEMLSPEESKKIAEERPDRILRSRYVLPVNAKAPLCLQGHLCPDSRAGQVQVESPTVERCPPRSSCIW